MRHSFSLAWISSTTATSYRLLMLAISMVHEEWVAPGTSFFSSPVIKLHRSPDCGVVV